MRVLKFCLYDNACALASHCRNQARKNRTGLAALLAILHFVLDAWHNGNHTACKVTCCVSHAIFCLWLCSLFFQNPASPWYLPEVERDQYPELAEVPTSLNECWNSWVDRFCPEARHMHPATLNVFAVLLANMWNEFIVGTSRLEVGCFCFAYMIVFFWICARRCCVSAHHHRLNLY